MTYGRFPPKSSWNSTFVVRESRVRGCLAEASNPWIVDNKSQIWATFRQKSTLGHKSTYSSFKKLIYKNFFCLIEFQLFHISASFDLNFLAKSHTKYFQNGLKLLHLSQPSTWAIFRWWSRKLNQMSPPDRSDGPIMIYRVYHMYWNTYDFVSHVLYLVNFKIVS